MSSWACWKARAVRFLCASPAWSALMVSGVGFRGGFENPACHWVRPHHGGLTSDHGRDFPLGGTSGQVLFMIVTGFRASGLPGFGAAGPRTRRRVVTVCLLGSC